MIWYRSDDTTEGGYIVEGLTILIRLSQDCGLDGVITALQSSLFTKIAPSCARQLGRVGQIIVRGGSRRSADQSIKPQLEEKRQNMSIKRSFFLIADLIKCRLVSIGL